MSPNSTGPRTMTIFQADWDYLIHERDALAANQMKAVEVYASATRTAWDLKQICEERADYYITLRQLEHLLSKDEPDAAVTVAAQQASHLEQNGEVEPDPTQMEKNIRRQVITQVLATIQEGIGSSLPDSVVERIWRLV